MYLNSSTSQTRASSDIMDPQKKNLFNFISRITDQQAISEYETKYLQKLTRGESTNIVYLIQALDHVISKNGPSIVFNCLVVIHILLNEGARGFISIFASQCREVDRLEDFNDDRSQNSLYQSKLIRTYAKYLSQLSTVTLTLGKNYLIDSDRRERDFVDMPVLQLLDHIETFQKQLDSLLRFNRLEISNESKSKEMLKRAYKFCIGDCINLYIVLNQASIALLNVFFGLRLKEAKCGLKYFKHFCEEMDDIRYFCQTVERIQVVHNYNVPHMNEKTITLIPKLERYVEDRENAGSDPDLHIDKPKRSSNSSHHREQRDHRDNRESTRNNRDSNRENKRDSRNNRESRSPNFDRNNDNDIRSSKPKYRSSNSDKYRTNYHRSDGEKHRHNDSYHPNDNNDSRSRSKYDDDSRNRSNHDSNYNNSRDKDYERNKYKNDRSSYNRSSTNSSGNERSTSNSPTLAENLLNISDIGQTYNYDTSSNHNHNNHHNSYNNHHHNNNNNNNSKNSGNNNNNNNSDLMMMNKNDDNPFAMHTASNRSINVEEISLDMFDPMCKIDNSKNPLRYVQ